MCVTSMIGDHYQDKWRGHPWLDKMDPFRISPPASPWAQPQPDDSSGAKPVVFVSRDEFEALKRDVAEMKELLRRAKEYDERNGEPECEIDEKMALLRRVASAVGVDLDAVLGTKPA